MATELAATAGPDKDLPHSLPGSGGKRFEFLESVRGAAILLVFSYHAIGISFGQDQAAWGTWLPQFSETPWLAWLWPLSLGWSGVAIFFVVSGFCVHLSFAKDPRWRAYFVRRFFRIYPPYLLALVTYAISQAEAPTSGAFWSHVLLLHNLNQEWIFEINPSFWSLAVEWQLYLLYPALLYGAGCIGWRRMLLLLLVVESLIRTADGLSLTIAGAGLPRLLGMNPLAFWFSWAAGAYVAEEYLQRRVASVSAGVVWVLVALGTAAYFVRPITHLSFTLFALATAIQISRLVSVDSKRHALASRIDGVAKQMLSRAGGASFSIYLWHQPLLLFLVRSISTSFVPLGQSEWVLFALSIASWPLFSLLGSFSQRILEEPSLRLGRRLSLP